MIQYVWVLCDNETFEPIKSIGNMNTSGSGEISFYKKWGFRLAAKTKNGKELGRWWGHWRYMHFGIIKAVRLGYWVKTGSYLIKMKFKIGDEIFETLPMVVFKI